MLRTWSQEDKLFDRALPGHGLQACTDRGVYMLVQTLKAMGKQVRTGQVQRGTS